MSTLVSAHAGAWAAVVLVGAHRLARRRRGAPPRLPAHGCHGRTGRRSTGQRLTAVAARLGRGVRRACRRPPAPAGDARLGWAVLAGLLAATAVPTAAPPVGALVWAAPAAATRRRARRHAAELRRTMPEVVDLLAVAIGAGLTVRLATAAVARRAPGQLATELGRVAAATAHGRRLADTLDEIPLRLGEATRPVVAALVASERYGAPLADALDRIAADARADRRRRGEAAARRVPVTLLFPLVCCILPAFALLTVAPLIAGALGSLGL